MGIKAVAKNSQSKFVHLSLAKASCVLLINVLIYLGKFVLLGFKLKITQCEVENEES
jgi:hypothetical protein